MDEIIGKGNLCSIWLHMAVNTVQQKSIASKLSPDAGLIIVTVGLADVKDLENRRNIRNSIQTQITEVLFHQTQIFHLHGAINIEAVQDK